MSFTCPKCGMVSHNSSDQQNGYCANCHEFTIPGMLVIWTLYKHPRDYPDQYVARKWLVAAGKESATPHVITHSDLEVLRRRMREMHLTRLPRIAGDDPVIVESWL